MSALRIAALLTLAPTLAEARERMPYEYWAPWQWWTGWILAVIAVCALALAVAFFQGRVPFADDEGESLVYSVLAVIAAAASGSLAWWVLS